MSIYDGFPSLKPTYTENARIKLNNVYKEQIRSFLDKKAGGSPGPGDSVILPYISFGFKKISAKTKKDGNAQIKLSKPRSSTQNNLNSTRRTRRKKTNSMAPTTSGNPQRMGRKGRRIQILSHLWETNPGRCDQGRKCKDNCAGRLKHLRAAKEGSPSAAGSRRCRSS